MELSRAVILVITFPLAFLIIYAYCCYKLSYWRRRGVPQLRNTSKIFGDFKNAVLFRTAPGYHIGCIYREAPPEVPLVGFYIFHKPCLLLKDPEIIKNILIRDFKNFPDRHFAGPLQKDSVGMVNLFGIKGPSWMYLRKKITPTFTSSKLKQMLPLMLETGEAMMGFLRNQVDSMEAVVDVQDLAYKYTTDMVANVALGTKTDSFNHPDTEYSKCLMGFFYSLKRMVALVTVFFVPELTRISGSLLLFDMSNIRKIFWRAVETREKSGGKRGDYIDSIIHLKNGTQDPLYKFEGDNLLSQSTTFFSGFESSATATAFTLMELASNKKCQNLAREDIRQSIDKYGWTIEAFNDMPYLEKCIAEGTRMYPPISTIDRCALDDYEIPDTNIIIKKGTPIYISLYGLHRDPQFFENPTVFDPSRFSGQGKAAAYLPFGEGPRKCIGMKAGQLFTKVVLSLILSEYEVHREFEKNKFDSRATFTAAADGITLKLSKI